MRLSRPPVSRTNERHELGSTEWPDKGRTFLPTADSEEANEVTASPAGRLKNWSAHYPGDSIAYQAQSLLITQHHRREKIFRARYITNV